jgi:hypothetical protein
MSSIHWFETEATISDRSFCKSSEAAGTVRVGQKQTHLENLDTAPGL